MNNVFRALAVVALAGVMALGVGCASQGAGSSAASGSSSAAAAAGVAAGEHEIAVTLSGGSGKATVESPAKLVVADDGSMTATIVWSSPNYDKMVVDGAEHPQINKSGNSTFEIPVAALDEDLAVQAETVAMSEPHMIDYTLRFDSSTLS